jgi:hypothetical protein
VALSLAYASVVAGASALAAATIRIGDFRGGVVVIGAIVAVICGIAAIAIRVFGSWVRKSWINSVTTLTLAIAGTAMGIAAPGRVRMCCGSPMASAIGALREINSAENTYESSCAPGGFAVDLADLAAPPPGSSQGFISYDLNHNHIIRNGYIITLTRDAAAGVKDVGSAAATCNGAKNQPASSYFATADPIARTEGRWYLATDARGTIYESTTGPIGNPIRPGPDVRVLP